MKSIFIVNEKKRRRIVYYDTPSIDVNFVNNVQPSINYLF